MKTNLPFFAALLSVATTLTAAPVQSTTAVHTKPDEASPSITFIKAGTDPIPAAESLASTPAGWMAIELNGPFDAYVQDRDLTKGLDMKPGISVYLGPKIDSGVLTTALKEDKTNSTGQRGRWLQIRLERKLIGYIHVGGTPGYLPPIATATAGSGAAPAPAPLAPAPFAPAAYCPAEAGHAAPVVSAADSTSSLPRQFIGKLVTTKRPLRPRRPYDWALNDDADKRYAYVDTSKLILAQPIDILADHAVVIFGSTHASADGKDLVIEAESLQLK